MSTIQLTPAQHAILAKAIHSSDGALTSRIEVGVGTNGSGRRCRTGRRGSQPAAKSVISCPRAASSRARWWVSDSSPPAKGSRTG